MSRNYPFIRDSGALLKRDTQSECPACHKKSTHWVRIAGDYMRGNDDVFEVCERHYKIAEKRINQFFSHIATKVEQP